MLIVVLLSTVNLFAQDVTVPGPAGCNSTSQAGAFPVPCGVTTVTVELYGGGGGAGGGGGGSNGGFYDTRGGGGAGGGGYTTITVDVTPGSVFNYSIASGGCGGGNGSDFNDGDNGNGGGNTTITGTDANGNPVNLAANGGGSGGGGDGTEGSPGSGGAGGTASGGSTNTNGTAGNNGSGGNGGVGGAGAGPAGGNGGGSQGAPGAIYGGGGAGGGNSNGGAGAAGAILITFVNQGPPSVTPTIATAAATCSSDGTSTITNYSATETYVFTPTGPTVGAGGLIAGMVPGTSYTVVAGAGACASAPSNSFSNDAATGTVVDPIVSTTPPTCTADGSSTITTYNAANTYDFTPVGPTVGAGGLISGMTVGTNYTVTESDLTCTSAPSAPFSNGAQLTGPTISISGTLSYCLGSNTTITASGGTSYLWDDPANSTTAAITVTQGTYTVVGTDANGCTGTATAVVTETSAFAINFSGGLNVCPGGTSDITASGGVSYSWSTGANTATATLPQGTHTVTATDATGCMSTADVTITETPEPVADFLVVDACAGDAVQFTDATTLASGALTNWDWDFGDGNTSTLQDPTHVYAQPGTYDVTLTASAGSCADQITLQATVFEIPVADFTTANVCVGLAADFLDNSSVTGSAITQWAWDFDGLGNSVQQSPSYNFPAAGTYTVTLGVLSSDFCAATYSEQITIYPVPLPTFTATVVCEGVATTFLNESTVSSGSIAAQAWDFGDNSGTSLNVSPTYTYSSAGTYAVSLGVTTANGCIAATFQNVTVNPLPSVDASHTDILCAGESNGSAMVAASGGTAPYTYQWNDASQSTSTSIGNLTPGQYTITVTDAEGCISDTTVVVTEPLPFNIQLVSYPDTCGLQNGAIRATLTGGTAPFEYQWSSIRDSVSIYSVDLPPTGWNTLLATGDYSVIVTDDAGCTVQSAITVDLIAPPIAAFDTRSDPEELRDPTVQFVNGSTNAFTYEWHFGDGEIGYEEDPLHIYDASGSVLVMLIAYNDPQFGCADTTFGYIEVAPFFTFYVPNAFTPDEDGKNDTWGPVGDYFEYESYNVKVFDRWGGLLWQTDNPTHWWDGLNQNTLEPVKQGMYIYQFVIRRFDTFEPKIISGTVTVYRHK